MKRQEAPKQNTEDKRINGNQPSILTEEDVHQIRWCYSFGFLQKEIAEAFGVSASMISKIILGKRWSHLAN